MIEAVIFDMDGVLIDSEGIYIEWLSDYARKMGYSMTEEMLVKTVGLSSDMSADYFDSVLGKGLGRHFWYGYLELCDTCPFDYSQVLNPGVRDLLEQLKNSHLKIGLASASDRKDIEDMLEANDIGRYFDVVLSGAEFQESKPNPEIYLKAINELDVLPERCVVIEDSDYGIRAAKSAGAQVIAKEERRFGFSQAEADIVVKDMTEVWAWIFPRIFLNDIVENEM